MPDMLQVTVSWEAIRQWAIRTCVFHDQSALYHRHLALYPRHLALYPRHLVHSNVDNNILKMCSMIKRTWHSHMYDTLVVSKINAGNIGELFEYSIIWHVL